MTTDSNTYLTILHGLLNQHFNLAEIQTLCFNLNVDYESVSGEEKPSRIRELLLALGRNGRLPELITLAQQERPHIAWPPVPVDFHLPESLTFGDAAPLNQYHYHYHIYGDMVQGDKISVGNISGQAVVALGADSIAKVDYRVESSNSFTTYVDNKLAGQLYKVPRLKGDYVQRVDEINTLRHILIEPAESINAPTCIGIQGMVGVGKSTIASALAHDYLVRRTFSDGIFWLSFGKQSNPKDQWIRLRRWLEGSDAQFEDVNDAQEFFERITLERECLIILDDIWQSEHVEAFLRLGQKCRLLITARSATILDEIDAYQFEIGLLNDEQAYELLAKTSTTPINDLPPESKGIIQYCENLPLALSMVGAMVKRKSRLYWRDALDRLQNANLEGIAAKFRDYPHPNLFAALEVSIAALDEELRECYYDFAIFPDGVAIPETLPLILWLPMGKSDVLDNLTELVNRNLLRSTENGSLTLHNLFSIYLRKEVTDLPDRHDRLLNNYNPEKSSWAKAKFGVSYMHDHLAYHLASAGRLSEMVSLFDNSEWMETRFQQSEFIYNGYISDIEFAAKQIMDTTDESNKEETVVRLLRLGLIKTSITSINTNYDPDLIAQLLERALWSAQRCVKVLARIANHKWRAVGAGKLLATKVLPEHLSEQVEEIGVTAVESEDYSGEQIKLLKELTPHLNKFKQKAIFLWLDAAAKIPSNFYRAEALLPLIDLIRETDVESKDKFERIVDDLVTGYWDFARLSNFIETNPAIADPELLMQLEQIAASIPESHFERPIASHIQKAQMMLLMNAMGMDGGGMFRGFFSQLEKLSMADEAHMAASITQLGAISLEELKQALESSLSIADEGLQAQVLAKLLNWIAEEQFPVLLHEIQGVLKKGEERLESIEYSFDLYAQLMLGRARVVPFINKTDRDDFIVTLFEALRASNYLLSRGNIFDDLAALFDRDQIKEALEVLLAPPSGGIPIFWSKAIAKLLNRLETQISDPSEIKNMIQRFEQVIKEDEKEAKNFRRAPLLLYFPIEQREEIIYDTLDFALHAPSAIALLESTAKDSPIFQAFIQQLLTPETLDNTNFTGLLSYIVLYLNQDQLNWVIDKVIESNNYFNGTVDDLRLLANLLFLRPKNPHLLRLAQSELINILFAVIMTDAIKREVLLNLLKIAHVLEPLLLSQETLQIAANQIIEICNNWRWL